VRFLLALFATLVIGGCATAADDPAAEPSPDEPVVTPAPDDAATSPAPDADTVAVVLRGPDGDERAFTVEVAADRPTRQLGLMHRTELADDAGMLFLFPEDTEGGFWMKDTLIPLTIAFAEADGRVVAVLDMEPCPFETCPTYRPGVAYRMALEVNQGALDGVGPGWRLEVDGELPPAS
jgi:uncharacterized protein